MLFGPTHNLRQDGQSVICIARRIRVLCMKARHRGPANVADGGLPEGGIKVQPDERPVSLPRSRFQLGDVDSHELLGHFVEQRSLRASFQLLRTCVTACRRFRKDTERLLACGLDCPGAAELADGNPALATVYPGFDDEAHASVRISLCPKSLGLPIPKNGAGRECLNTADGELIALCHLPTAS